MKDFVIPKTISEHRYGKLLGRIWTEVHTNDGIVTIIVCGKRGKGKSLSMFELGRILDRDGADVTRFTPDDIYLDVVDFLKALTGDYKRGKVICLDDAGLHMYKSDALSSVLKTISKILQNIRYKHPIIIMSLPYFRQLMKDARDMTDIYIEMFKVDRKKKIVLGSIQALKISAFTGDLYRYSVMQTKDVVDPIFDISYHHLVARMYEFEKPPDDFVKAYESKKRIVLDKINAEHLQTVKTDRDNALGRPSRRQLNFSKEYEFISSPENRPKFVNDKGKYDASLLMMEVDEDGNQRYKREYARLLARRGNADV